MKLANQWKEIRKCPACCSADVTYEGILRGDYYTFGNAEIPFPEEGICLVRCRICGLIYKSIVPSPSFLVEVFSDQAGNVWQDKYSYKSERGFIIKLIGKKSFDLLDIGPSNGGLLRSCSDLQGRRSGLDIVMHPGLGHYINGEFIQALLDDQTIPWNGEPFDVITAFDVLEHLYEPSLAFKNLNKMTKDGGFVIIETGDADSIWPQKYGFSQWWYARLFEHHIFWTERSLLKIANKYGFEIESIIRKRHKNRQEWSWLRKMSTMLQTGLYQLLPKHYERLTGWCGMRESQPQSLFTRDHLLVVLKKKCKRIH